MRYVYLILFFAIMAAPFAVRRVVTQPPPPLRAGSDRLVVVTPHNQDIRREFARAFDRWHRSRFGKGVDIDYRTAGGTPDIKRLLETTYRPYRAANGAIPDDVPADYDVVWGGGDYFFDREIKPLGILQPARLSPELLGQAFPQAALAGVRLYDASRNDRRPPEPLWVGVCLSSFGIIYNPELYETMRLTAPTQWNELTNPKLAGLIALADPSHSGSAAVAYMMVLQRAMADAEEELFARRPELRKLGKKARDRTPSTRPPSAPDGIGAWRSSADCRQRAVLHRRGAAGADRRGQRTSGGGNGHRFLCPRDRAERRPDAGAIRGARPRRPPSLQTRWRC